MRPGMKRIPPVGEMMMPSADAGSGIDTGIAPEVCVSQAMFSSFSVVLKVQVA